MGSELKQLLAEITLQYEAAKRALHAPAMVAKHEFITARMEQIQVTHEKVKQLVGNDEKAMAMVLETMAISDTREELKEAI